VNHTQPDAGSANLRVDGTLPAVERLEDVRKVVAIDPDQRRADVAVLRPADIFGAGAAAGTGDEGVILRACEKTRPGFGRQVLVASERLRSRQTCERARAISSSE